MNSPQNPPATTLEQELIFEELRPADGIVIAFGIKGVEQYAHVVPRRGHNKGIRIWRRSSKSWTNARRLFAGEILRKASAKDIAYFKPNFGIPWERNY